MPYNFEATFSQPILAKLDGGLIKGSKDWANTITKAYITTIKAGIPQGVPPILPAPGLGTPPPPYPIGTTGYSTADLHSKKFYNIVYAYFYAKELKLDKQSISGLISTIKQLIIKLKARTTQVRLLVDAIKLVKEELKNLPKLLKDIEQSLKDEVKQQIQSLQDAFKINSKFKAELDPAEFDTLFREENELLTKIKNFNLTNINDVRELTLLLSVYGRRTDSTINSISSPRNFKIYLQKRIIGVGKILISLADGLFDPSKIINLVGDLKNKSTKTNRLYKQLKQFDTFERYIQPKLRRLELKKRALVKDIKESLQKKVVDLRTKLDLKIIEYQTKKKEGKKDNLYSKAKKNITDLKKDNESKIKKVRSNIKTLRLIYKDTVTVVGKITTLKAALDQEFILMKDDIVKFQKSVANISLQSTQLTPINFNSGSVEVSGINNTIKSVRGYVASIGLAEFGNQAALLVTQTKIDLQTFKRFFEIKNRRIKQYSAEISTLSEDIQRLVANIRSLGGLSIKEKRNKGKAIGRLESLKDVLQLVVSTIRPEIKRIQSKIKAKIIYLRDHIVKQLLKFKENLKTFAINLVPIKTSVQDPKNKKAQAQAKLTIIQDKARDIKSIIKKTSLLVKAGKGFVKVASNIDRGIYTVSENQVPIIEMVDGYYGYRMYEQPKGIIEELTKEKASLKQDLEGIVIIDMLGRALLTTFKGVGDGKIKQDINKDLIDLKKTTISTNSLNTLNTILKSPPKNITELKDLANKLTLDVLQDASAANNLVQIEKKYLRKLKESIKTIFDLKLVQEGGKMSAKLTYILKQLRKNDSFIMLLLKTLKEMLETFVKTVKVQIGNFVTTQKNKLRKKKEKREAQFKMEQKNQKSKDTNIDARAMGIMFGLAARIFWTGATWTSPNGTRQLVYSIGSFGRIKAKSIDGASGLIREMARGFERQLFGMKGLINPIAATGIPPFPFTSYK